MATKRQTKKPAAPVPPASVPMGQRLRSANRWREQYNPTFGLKMSTARSLVDSYLRGEFADVMWLFGAPFAGIENSDADLLALIELRTSAIMEMDWQIKIRTPRTGPDGTPLRDGIYDKVLAAEQAAALDEAYDGIDNLYEAIEHLASATFRGFAHLEKYTSADGDVYHLHPVNQWNIVRDGISGNWKYNPEAQQCGFRFLPEDHLIDPREWLIREVRRPVNRIALTKYIRMGLSQKDWDAFIEIYGVPGGVVILPPNVPAADVDTYREAAKDVAQGGSGSLPNGSQYITNDSPRGTNPFHEHLKYLTEQLVLAGTGGKLTMLAESGSGTLAGGAHTDTFNTIARGEARRINGILQRGLDTPLLDREFPGRPALAYWELCFAEETDTGDFIKGVSSLATAGYQVDPAQVSEKTGYKVTVQPMPLPAVPPGTPLRNRRTGTEDEEAKQFRQFMDLAAQEFRIRTAEDLQPLRTALQRILDADEADLPERLQEFVSSAPDLAKQVAGAKGGSEALQQILSSALFEGLTV